MEAIIIDYQTIEVLPKDPKPVAPQFAVERRIKTRLAGKKLKIFFMKQTTHRTIG
jgi:hypothetical protein